MRYARIIHRFATFHLAAKLCLLFQDAWGQKMTELFFELIAEGLGEDWEGPNSRPNLFQDLLCFESWRAKGHGTCCYDEIVWNAFPRIREHPQTPHPEITWAPGFWSSITRSRKPSWRYGKSNVYTSGCRAWYSFLEVAGKNGSHYRWWLSYPSVTQSIGKSSLNMYKIEPGTAHLVSSNRDLYTYLCWSFLVVAARNMLTWKAGTCFWSTDTQSTKELPSKWEQKHVFLLCWMCCMWLRKDL